MELLDETQRRCKELLIAYRHASKMEGIVKDALGAKAHQYCMELERHLDSHTERIYGFPWFRIFVYWLVTYKGEKTL